jgi:stage V sporulation protein AD
MSLYIKNGTIQMSNPPSITSFAAVVGKKEGEGPLASCFDVIHEDVSLGGMSWEKAESEFQKQAFETALMKSGLAMKDIDFVFAGDLLNQCISSNYSLRNIDISFIGLFGACSTMAQSLSLAAIFVDNMIGQNIAAVTSSHFCSAERQFRFPINYGGQRTPTSQWTATAAGCSIVSPHSLPPYIKAVTIGKIKDKGIKDANNMGAAMAYSAYDTISQHLNATSQKPDNFDLILTGDLGKVGSDMLVDLFMADGIDISTKHNDCGLMLYDIKEQNMHAGGSGCGCSASVLCGHILKRVQSGDLKNVLFTATGALMSTVSSQQGESIPGIAHSVHISYEP